ncbi:MAG: hypothetical protein V1798_04790 [Pseudomonadota bacterium]
MLSFFLSIFVAFFLSTPAYAGTAPSRKAPYASIFAFFVGGEETMRREEFLRHCEELDHERARVSASMACLVRIAVVPGIEWVPAAMASAGWIYVNREHFGRDLRVLSLLAHDASSAVAQRLRVHTRAKPLTFVLSHAAQESDTTSNVPGESADGVSPDEATRRAHAAEAAKRYLEEVAPGELTTLEEAVMGRKGLHALREAEAALRRRVAEKEGGVGTEILDDYLAAIEHLLPPQFSRLPEYNPEDPD